MATERYSLQTKALSMFARASDLAELKALSEDAILFAPAEPRPAYILRLAGARFIPEDALWRLKGAARHPLPDGLFYDRGSGTNHTCCSPKAARSSPIPSSAPLR